MKKRIVIIVVFVLILMVVGFGWYICRQADASDSESRIGNIFAGGIVANLSDELYFMETVGNDTGLYRSDGSLESKKKIRVAIWGRTFFGTISMTTITRTQGDGSNVENHKSE